MNTTVNPNQDYKLSEMKNSVTRQNVQELDYKLQLAFDKYYSKKNKDKIAPFVASPLHAYERYKKFVRSYGKIPSKRYCFTLKNEKRRLKNFFQTGRNIVDGLTLIENNKDLSYVSFRNDLKNPIHHNLNNELIVILTINPTKPFF
jgi:hypothetical protein